MSAARGEIWGLDLGNPIGHEAGLRRWGLVVSADPFNQFGLLTVCALTTTRLGYNTHLEVEPAESGLSKTSYIQVEQIRTVSHERLDSRAGAVGPATMHRVGTILRLLLEL